jgi:hypothetical protein
MGVDSRRVSNFVHGMGVAVAVLADQGMGYLQ